MSLTTEDCRVIQIPFDDRPTTEQTLEVLSEHGFTDACVLFTCLRSEIYLVGEPVRPLPFPIKAVLKGGEAVTHIFEVACGLRSNVIGEAEILGQLRTAHASALRAGMCHGLLDRIIQGAVTAGKRVRTETTLAQGTMCIASAIHAIIAEQAPHHDRLVIIGAGSVGTRLARLLHTAQHPSEVCIVNRTLETARDLASETGAVAADLTTLPDILATADVVVVAVGGGAVHIADPALFREGTLVIDVSAPPTVHMPQPFPAISHFGLHDVEERMGRASAGRHEAIPQARTIIAEEIAAVDTWSLARRIDPLLRHVEDVMRNEGRHDEELLDNLLRSFRRSIFSSIQHRHVLPHDVADALLTLGSRKAMGS